MKKNSLTKQLYEDLRSELLGHVKEQHNTVNHDVRPYAHDVVDYIITCDSPSWLSDEHIDSILTEITDVLYKKNCKDCRRVADELFDLVAQDSFK